VDLFLFVDRLPVMARRTVDVYGMFFLIHFQHIALSRRGLDYFAQALSDIRTAARTRTSRPVWGSEWNM
jgi:hypothetical protein